MPDITQYAPQVELAISKFAASKNKADKDDYRQECYLALLENADKISGEGYAYQVAKHRIIDLLRAEKDDVVDTNIADVNAVQLPDALSKLESEELINMIESLPREESTAIKMLYGVEGEPRSVEYVAAFLLTTASNIRQIRDLAVGKLRNLLRRTDGI